MLNDTIIEFYLKYIHNCLVPVERYIYYSKYTLYIALLHGLGGTKSTFLPLFFTVA